jgi:hypothetical protein
LAIITCKKCGQKTNTTVSDWIGEKDGNAKKCYAAFVSDKWVKGCSYDTADPFTKDYVNKLLLLKMPAVRPEELRKQLTEAANELIEEQKRNQNKIKSPLKLTTKKKKSRK